MGIWHQDCWVRENINVDSLVARFLVSGKYPVNYPKYGKIHHVQWSNRIYMAIFKSYFDKIRGYIHQYLSIIPSLSHYKIIQNPLLQWNGNAMKCNESPVISHVAAMAAGLSYKRCSRWDRWIPVETWLICDPPGGTMGLSMGYSEGYY